MCGDDAQVLLYVGGYEGGRICLLVGLAGRVAAGDLDGREAGRVERASQGGDKGDSLLGVSADKHRRVRRAGAGGGGGGA